MAAGPSRWYPKGMVRTGSASLFALGVLAAASVAGAQPAPLDPYATPAQDPVLAEQVAAQLVERAGQLFEDKVYLDAKQLAVEALVQSPNGPAAARAKAIVKAVDAQLGIKGNTAAPPPVDDKPPIDTPAIDDTHRGVAVQAPVEEGPIREGRTAASVHAAIYGGLIGATLGSFFSKTHPAGGAIPVAIGVGLAAGVYVPGLFKKKRWDEAQIRTVGSGSVWGGVVGGLFADVVQGANGGTVTARGVLVGASVGSTIGLLGGLSMASDHRLTRGDVALVDTLAGLGTAGGLTIGLVMQPAQKEAYSLNAVLGAAGGVIAGLVAAPQTNTTPRRMLRVAGLAAAGGVLPFLVYAVLPKKSAEQRLTGALSTAGLVGGAWLGFYLTRDVDVGLDVPDRARKLDDAPPAVVGRSSDGTWRVGGPAVSPLADHRGMAVTVVGGAF